MLSIPVRARETEGMETEMDHVDLVIIGAGISGLVAASELRDRGSVVVVDKGRGVGGRMATRRIGGATFDHGAQFLTTHSERFEAMVADWSDAGLVQEWYRGRVGPQGLAEPSSEGHPRFRGRVSMNAIAKHLAEGTDVRRSSRVTTIAQRGDAWELTLETGEQLRSSGLVLTAPVPQSLALLDAGSVALDDEDRGALDAIEYAPCVAVLATLDGPSGLPLPGAVDPDSGPIDWMADNSVKGISERSAVTIHATADFSRNHWESSDDEIVELLVDAAALASAPAPGAIDVQRWRYSDPVAAHDAACLVATGLPLLVFAGDAFGHGKVEGAALSGLAAAAAVRAASA